MVWKPYHEKVITVTFCDFRATFLNFCDFFANFLNFLYNM
nr:MAG TPA: hypothetical protein [Caudoviricetes sp.]